MTTYTKEDQELGRQFAKAQGLPVPVGIKLMHAARIAAEKKMNIEIRTSYAGVDVPERTLDTIEQIAKQFSTFKVVAVSDKGYSVEISDEEGRRFLRECRDRNITNVEVE